MTESGRIFEAALAQLAERKTEDLEVAGSTPAGGIVFFFIFLFFYYIKYGKVTKKLLK